MNRYILQHYPPNWESLAKACKEQAGWCCEECGVEQFDQLISKRGKPYFVYLHAAHVHHDKDNPDPELRALCVACHARYDYQYKQREARIRLERMKHLKLLVERGVVICRAFL